MGGTSWVGGSGSGGGGTVSVGGLPSFDSSELYDPERVPRFDLDLEADALASLTEYPDEYVRATLRYGSEVVTDIGVRLKGEASARSLKEKAAFKLKFNELVDGQSFRGLRGMTFNNMVEDPTFLAERLAYHFFRSLGIPAPRCNSALVYVNGEPFGLYANVETEDKAFLRRWFESDDGNLYEETGVDFEPGNEADFDLETNERENDRSDLKALITAIAYAKPHSFLEDVGAELDMPHFLAFTAAEGAVNQWDMYAHSAFHPNNFRIYRDPYQQRFVMLPWGMDISMQPFLGSGQRHLSLLSLTRWKTRAHEDVTSGLIFRECLNSQPCKAAYRQVVADTAAHFERANLVELATRYYDQIKEHVAADPRKEVTLDEFEQAAQVQREVIAERPAAMREALAHDEENDDDGSGGEGGAGSSDRDDD